jgi:hypothetical protein
VHPSVPAQRRHVRGIGRDRPLPGDPPGEHAGMIVVDVTVVGFARRMMHITSRKVISG